MNWMIDNLIFLLTELKGMSLLLKLITLAGIPALFGAIYIIPHQKNKIKKLISDYNNSKIRNDILERTVLDLQGEIEKLTKNLPSTFISLYENEVRNGYEENANALAKDFITRERKVLETAFRACMKNSIWEAIEDGPAGFEAARRWGLAALALEPEDQMLRILIDDLGAAAGIALAPKVRVNIKGEKDREKRIKYNDRLPDILDALEKSLFIARSKGLFYLMLVLAENGAIITKRPPYGEETKEHLLFCRHKAEALDFLGNHEDAFERILPLEGKFTDTFGMGSLEDVYTRFLIAKFKSNLGRVAEAIPDLQCLSKLAENHHGNNHPHVLAIRHLLVECKASIGQADDALIEANDLLPVYIKTHGKEHVHTLAVRFMRIQLQLHTNFSMCTLAEAEDIFRLYAEKQGEHHPSTLTARHLVAQILEEVGRNAEAFDIINEILEISSDVLGEEHPDTLDIRTSRANCLITLERYDDAALELEQVKEKLDATQHNSNVRYFARLDRAKSRMPHSYLNRAECLSL